MAQPQSVLSSSGNVEPRIDPNDWRAKLPLDSRHMIVNKLTETLKKNECLCMSRTETLKKHEERKKIAERVEENIYSIAASLSDYLTKISLKMITMETKCQSPTACSDLASLVSITQTAENTGAGDWQEEVYQKIKSMKDMYLLEINEMYVKVATKLQQHEALPQKLTNEVFDMLTFFKLMLERFIEFVQLSKNDIQIRHRDRLGTVEKQIITTLYKNKPRKIAPLQPPQLPQPHMPWMQNSQPQSQISHVQNSQPQSQISHMQISQLQSQPEQLPQPHMSGMQNSQLQSQISHVQNHENQMNPLMQPMNVQTSEAIEQLIQRLEKLMYTEQIDLNIVYPKETVAREGGDFEDMDCR